MPKFTAPKGTLDVLAPQSRRYAALVARGSRNGRTAAGYDPIVLPMFEDAEVFRRVGESTDVVRKEMYEFEDKGGRRIALKPDGTAPVARAFIEHRPTTPWKVWYVTPKFRYERPQKGRYRQHHELGLEALGSDDPDLDVEVIAVAIGHLRRSRAARHRVEADVVGRRRVPARLPADVAGLPRERGATSCVTSTGTASPRTRCASSTASGTACISATADAPKMVDNLCEPCAAHFARVRAGLDAFGIGYALDPRLVRGLDYYTRTTFEFAADALDARAECRRWRRPLRRAGRGAGRRGRRPGSASESGSSASCDACDAEGVFPAPTSGVDVFVIDTTGGEAARDITDALRTGGIGADRAFDNRSFKSQMTAAQRSGARAGRRRRGRRPADPYAARKGRARDRHRVTTVVDTVRKRLS